MDLPSGHSRQIIADGPKGTAQTIDIMRGLVNTGKRSIKVRQYCGEALNPPNGDKAKSKDYFEYASRLYRKVRDGILYAYDPAGVEFCESADRLLETKIGDCDSMDILLCSMFEAIGLQSQFVTIMADPSRPGEFTHVYTRVMIPKYGWIVADPIMPDKYFGWEPPYPQGKKYWNASSDSGSKVDTSDSVPFSGPDQPDLSGPFGIGVSGMNGLGDLSHGGGHGGGRGFRRGGWGGGYAGPWYGGGLDSDIYVLPVVVASPANMLVVDPDDSKPQMMMDSERSMGMGRLNGNFGGVFDSITDIFSSAATSVSKTTELVNQIFDGTYAASISKQKSDNKALLLKLSSLKGAAQKISDSALRDATIKKIQAAQFTAIDANQKLNAFIGQYNSVIDVISKVNASAKQIPKIGLGFVIEIGAGAVALIVTALIASGVLAYFWSAKSDNDKAAALAANNTQQAAIETAKGIAADAKNMLDQKKITPAQYSDIVSGAQRVASNIPGVSGDSIFGAIGGPIVQTGLIFGALYVAYLLANRWANRPYESKPVGVTA